VPDGEFRRLIGLNQRESGAGHVFVAIFRRQKSLNEGSGKTGFAGAQISRQCNDVAPAHMPGQ